jgi:hypothetical protein
MQSKEHEMNLALPLLTLLLSLFGVLTASAQTTSTIFPNQGCVHIENCQVELDNFNWLWVEYSPYTFVRIFTQAGRELNSCTAFDKFSNRGQPDGSTQLHIECTGDNGPITVDRNAIGYRTRAGTRYLVTGGAASY